MGISWTGKELMRDLINGESSTGIDYTGWGAGSAAFDITDWALGSEIFPSGAADARNAFAMVDRRGEETIFNGILTSEQANQILYEIALFNTSSGGSLFCRQSFYRMDKTSTLEIDCDYTMRIEQE